MIEYNLNLQIHATAQLITKNNTYKYIETFLYINVQIILEPDLIINFAFTNIYCVFVSGMYLKLSTHLSVR